MISIFCLALLAALGEAGVQAVSVRGVTQHGLPASFLPPSQILPQTGPSPGLTATPQRERENPKHLPPPPSRSRGNIKRLLLPSPMGRGVGGEGEKKTLSQQKESYVGKELDSQLRGQQQTVRKLIELVAESGRVLQMAESPSQRLSPSYPIAPGAPPLLSFRYYEGKQRHRFGKLDLVMDDAGH